MYDPTNKPAVFSNRIEKRYEVSATIEEDGKVTTETRMLKSGRAILSHNRQFSSLRNPQRCQLWASMAKATIDSKLVEEESY